MKTSIATIESIAGREIAETLELMKGNIIQIRHIASDIVAGLKSIVVKINIISIKNLKRI